MLSLKAAILPVTPFQQNCTLIWDEDTKVGAVIDPGGDVARIKEAIDQTGMTVEKLVLTHGHIDHAGGAAELRDLLQADQEAGSGGGAAASTTGIIKIEGPHLADKFLLDGLDKAGAELGITDARPVTPDRWIEEGESLTIGPFTFDVLHCPGHTPGHLVYLNKDLKFALVGDVLFKGSIGRTDFPYGDHDALIDAIKTKLMPLDDEIAFICGHGPPSSIGEERGSNPFLV